jgi:ketosteroid isomerase-like protein
LIHSAVSITDNSIRNIVKEAVMAQTTASTSAGHLVERLCSATNGHDLDGLVSCFAADYVNETPAHPARGFRGRAQVRRNWEQIFMAVPDLKATVRWVEEGMTVWSEWEMRGTRRDGQAHLMRGVVIFGVEDGEATSARFYLEPVEQEGPGVDEAVRRGVGLAPAPVPGAPPASGTDR